MTQCVLSLRESILKTAKALVEDTKLLVAGAASSQEKLAQAAQSSAKTITQLTEVVKLGATSMGSEGPETQVIKIQYTFHAKECLIQPQMFIGSCSYMTFIFSQSSVRTSYYKQLSLYYDVILVIFSECLLSLWTPSVLCVIAVSSDTHCVFSFPRVCVPLSLPSTTSEVS